MQHYFALFVLSSGVRTTVLYLLQSHNMTNSNPAVLNSRMVSQAWTTSLFQRLPNYHLYHPPVSTTAAWSHERRLSWTTLHGGPLGPPLLGSCQFACHPTGSIDDALSTQSSWLCRRAAPTSSSSSGMTTARDLIR